MFGLASKAKCFGRILFLAALLAVFTGTVKAETGVRIVGGIEAPRGAWPFMAAIISAGSSPANGQYCGGSLIASRWVISAAHCFVDGNSVTPANEVQVALKIHNRSTDSGEILNVSRVIVHPQYNQNTSDNDIALLELSTPSTASPIALNSVADFTGVSSTIIGWGLTSENGSPSQVLRQASIPVVSNQVCNESYGGDITDNMVCAGLVSGGIDTCQGDSGGPLVIPSGSSYVLAGLTSFGVGCARPNFYGVYTRVSRYLSFISQYVSAEPPAPPRDLELTQFGLWNGNLSMVNIIELTNPADHAVTAQVNLYSADGVMRSANYYTIAAGAQRDVIVNQLVGFSAISFGLLHVSSNVTGRVAFYRSVQNAFEEFEYAFGVPLSTGLSDRSYIGFNTFDPTASGKLVANWLSVVNVGQIPATFMIRKYSSGGDLLSEASYTIPAFGRFDLDGGHVNPGASQVGLLEIEPLSGSTPYLAQLTRYGYGSSGSFDFAFPLIADSGWSPSAVIPLGDLYAPQNWLELVNIGEIESDFRVDFYGANGTLLEANTYRLKPHAQTHVYATAILRDNITGYARINALGSAFIAQSMFYFRQDNGTSIASMYGSQAGTPGFTKASGPYNLFLGMENYLRVTNTSNSNQNYTLSVASAFSPGFLGTQSIAANRTVLVPLHMGTTYGTVTNSYGVVSVTPSAGSPGLLTEVVRFKRYASGEVQFAMPTTLQEQ